MRRRQSSTPQAPEEQPTYPIVDDSCSGGGGGKLVCPVGPEQVTVEAAPPPAAAAATMPSGAAAAAAAIGGMQTPPPHAATAPQQPKFVIQPPIPPQHVYAPMPALGALSIGFLSKKDKKKEDADFRLITNGIITARAMARMRCLLCCSEWRSLERNLIIFFRLVFSADPEGPGICAMFLTLVSFVLVLVTLPFSLCVTVKVRHRGERNSNPIKACQSRMISKLYHHYFCNEGTF